MPPGTDDLLFDAAIKSLQNVTHVSGNLRNDLKRDILQAIKDLTKYVTGLKKSVEDCGKKIDRCQKEHGTSLNVPSTSKAKIYSEVVSGPSSSGPTIALKPADKKKKSFKLTVRPINEDVTSDETKALLKTNIDPVKLQLGICRLTSISKGGVLIETSSGNNVNLLCQEINKSCGASVVAKQQVKLLPRIIVFNIPDEVDQDNAIDVFKKQNKELLTKDSKVSLVKIWKNKKNNKQMVLEVDPDLRKALLECFVKLLWSFCRCDDYLTLLQCYHCFRFHHRADECDDKNKSPTCSHCGQFHTLDSCSKEDHIISCINCANFNKHTKRTTKFDSKHSALDKHCPYYKLLLDRKRDSIDYGF